MYQENRQYEYRPNTRKIYESHYGVTVLPWIEVHHVLPLRHGGTHDPGNLICLTVDEHIEAHMELYRTYGDSRDLCAAHMISGRSHEARLVASSMGGKRSQEAKKARGDKNGFQLFSLERRKEIAAKAGSIGGSKQRDEKLGFHGLSDEEKQRNSSLGGIASIEKNGFKDSARQSARGKTGGAKNKGCRWYNDGVNLMKYTVSQQVMESFDDFIKRNKFQPGKIKK